MFVAVFFITLSAIFFASGDADSGTLNFKHQTK